MSLRELLELAKITSLGSYAMKDDDESLIKIFNFSLKEVYSKIPGALVAQQKLNLVKGKTRYEYLAGTVKILGAADCMGNAIAINDDTDHYSIYNLGNNVLDVPMCVQHKTDFVVLTLQINPPKITCDNLDTLDFTPDDALQLAVISHMAYMVSKNISEDNGIGHFNECMNAINEVNRLGLYTPYQHSWTNKFVSDGWR